MAMSPQIVIQRLQAKRRTLRSNCKHPADNNNRIRPVKNDKVVKEIKSELEHQETHNSTKTSFPLHDDIKPLQEIIIHSQQPCLPSSKAQKPASVFGKTHDNVFVLRTFSLNQESSESSLEEKNIHSNELEKRQTHQLTPPANCHSKALKKTQASSLNAIGKSYRKIKKDHTRSVPFRRCQDQLQNRIVNLINKICQNKHNEKDIEIFSDKIIKISFKDLYNPYVISGIQTALNLLLKKSIQPHVNFTFIQTSSLLRLKNEVAKLSQKVWGELGKADDYEEIFHEKQEIDLEVAKPKLVRKVYKMLIQQRKCEPNIAKSKSFQVYETFITKLNQQTSEEELISFLREQKFMKI